MIVLFRIDYRLLHFQTASVWPNKVGADTIVIANDQVVKDQMQIGPVSYTHLDVYKRQRSSRRMTFSQSHWST